MCVYTFVCVGPKTVLGVWHVVPQVLFTLFSFGDRVSQWPGTFQVGWPASHSSWPVSASLALELKACVTWPTFKMCFLEIGKHITDRASWPVFLFKVLIASVFSYLLKLVFFICLFTLCVRVFRLHCVSVIMCVPIIMCVYIWKFNLKP